MGYYFAYGSNMNPARVKKRKMQFVSAVSGRLDDYVLRFNKRSVKVTGAASANVEKLKGAIVEGVLYELKDEDQIHAMDPFEGYPVRYDRVLLPVRTLSSDKAAWVYIANSDYVASGLKPANWYLAHLLAGKQYLSEDYYAALAKTDCLDDSELEPS